MNELQYVELDKSEGHCSVCSLAKQSRLLFPLSNIVSTTCFHTIHGDVWGPYRVPTYDGKRYFLTLVDDHSRYTWIFLLPSKGEVIIVLRNFLLMVQNVYSCSVIVLRTSNGYEFFNS